MNFLKTAFAKAKSLYKALSRKGRRYWITVLVLLVAGTIASEQLGERGVWINLRYRLYAKLQRVVPSPRKAKWSTLVLLDDDDYWKGPLERRIPLKRDYLAKLIAVIARAEPIVIALDIDLRAPLPERGNQEIEAYQQETEKLLQTIREVSKERYVVLATVVRGEESHRVVHPNVFDGYDFAGGKVAEGYVTLPTDLRKVPLAVRVKNRDHDEESFAGAIARTQAPKIVAEAEEFKERGFPYGSFDGRNDFTAINGGFVLTNENNIDALREKLRGKIVIVGGGWHTRYFKGPTDDGADSADLYFTPAGWIQGAYIHANYVEALLSGSVRERLPDFIGTIIEIICSLAVAVVFALKGSLRLKFLRVGLLCCGLVIFSYFLWQNLGIFFDFFIPIMLLSIHAPIEQLRETRVELHELRERLRILERPQTEESSVATVSSDSNVIDMKVAKA